MPSCNTYHFTWVSLTFGVGYLFTAALAKQSLLLTLDEGYLLTATLPDLQHGMAPLGPSSPGQPPFLGPGVAPPGHHSGFGRGVAPPGRRPWRWTRVSSSWPFLHHCSLALSAAAPDLRRGVTPLGHCPSGMGSSRLLPLTPDVGQLLSAALSVPVNATCT